MKQLEEIIKSYKSQALDGRDVLRLTQFLTEEQMSIVGWAPINLGEWERVPFTKENVLVQLEKDIAFGFEKALNKRSLSAASMFETVKMWNWILEEGLENWEEDQYAMYGLPLFKATAIKYGFDNPIGEDSGSELKYNEE